MSFTSKEIEKAISDYEEENGLEDSYEQVFKSLISEDEAEYDIPGIGKVEYAESYGGEGQGDEYWLVIKVGKQFFRVNGWYSSYEGGELDGTLEEVMPKQVVRTEYFSKKDQ